MSQAAYDYAEATRKARLTLHKLDDPLVREMAEHNHRPTESWSPRGDIPSLECGTCGQTWPCHTRQALRAMEATP